jgi:hypothetical protein
MNMSDVKKGSASFKLDWVDVWGVAKNALLVAGAAGLAVVAQNLHVLDLGSYGPLVVPIIAVGLDTAIKWMKNNSKED